MSRLSVRDAVFGQPVPSRLKAQRDLAGLIRVLSTSRYDAWRRREAATALGELGDVGAVEALVGVLRDGDHELRVMAAEALGKLGDRQAVEPLIAMLSDASVREAAARALAQLGDSRAVVPMLRAGEGGWIRGMGIPALKLLLDALADPELEGHARSVLLGPFVGAWGSSEAIEAVLAALRSENPAVRGTAAEVLGHSRDSRVTEPLAQLLAGEDSLARRAATFALAELGDARAIEPLAQALREDSADTGMGAADALGKLADERAVPPLLAALGDARRRIRHSAAAALNHRGWQPADDRERAARAVATEDWATAVGLGGAATESLVAMLGTADYEVRQAAARALAALDWRPADEQQRLWQTIAGGDWDQVAKSREAAVELLAALVEVKDRHDGLEPTPPWQAAHLLAESGDPRAVPATVRQLEASFFELRHRQGRLEGLEERASDPYDPVDYGVAEARKECEQGEALIRRQLKDLASFGAQGLAALEPLFEERRVMVPVVALTEYERLLACQRGEPAPFLLDDLLALLPKFTRSDRTLVVRGAKPLVAVTVWLPTGYSASAEGRFESKAVENLYELLQAAVRSGRPVVLQERRPKAVLGDSASDHAPAGRR